MEFQKYESGESQGNKQGIDNVIIAETPVTIVVDASICIKWFSGFKEDNVD